MTRRTHRPTQLSLELPTPRTHGGRRAGAGRKPSAARRGAPHRARPAITRHQAVHVSLPVVRAVGNLRRPAGYAAVRHAIAACIGRTDFRVVHASIQANHIHVLVEADDKGALSRGLRAFTTACARSLNAALGRTGRVFAGRYHATVISSPRQARAVLAYVLNNWRRHREHLAGAAARRATIDPYSSAVLFDGWADRRGRFALPPRYEPLPVAGARTWLLTTGWRAHHPPVALCEVPGPDEVLASLADGRDHRRRRGEPPRRAPCRSSRRW